MKKKMLTILIAIFAVCILAFTLFACNFGSSGDNRNAQILKIYNLYVTNAEENGEEPLSYEDWLFSIKGDKGEDGKTPKIEIIYGFWYIDGINTNVKATGENGTAGITPRLRINSETNYWEVSYNNGESWQSLNVKVTGENGNDGQPGKQGLSIYSVEFDEYERLVITLSDGTKLPPVEIPKKQDNIHTYGDWFDFSENNENPIAYRLCSKCKEFDFAEKFKINFDSNGGSTIDPIWVVSDELLIEPTQPTKAHYKFLGWYAEDGELFNFDVPILSNHTLIAKWETNFAGSIGLDEETAALLNEIDFDAGQDYTGTVSVKVFAVDTERAIINEIIKSFNKVYPNITVTVDETMPENYFGSLSKEYDNSLLADVFWLAQDYIDFVCSQEKAYGKDSEGNYIFLPEMLLPLSYIDNLDDSVDFKTDIIEEAYEVSTYRNELFMLPRDYNQVVMYYNMDMFDAAGVQYPGKEAMSQQEFLNMLDALRTGFKNASSDKIMANGQKYNEYFNASEKSLIDVNELWNAFSWPLFKSFGGTVCDDLNSVSFDSQENLNAIKFLANMKTQNYYNSSGNPDLQFKLQDRPILFHSRAVLPGLLNEVQGRKIKRLGVAPMPNFGGVEYAVGGGSSGYAMNRKAKDKTATWLFMKYIVSKSGQEALCPIGNSVPVLKELLKDQNSTWRNVELNGLGENFNHDAFIYGSDWELDERPFASTRDFFKYISASCQVEFIMQMEYVLNEINVTQETAKLQTALTTAAATMKQMVMQYPKSTA